MSVKISTKEKLDSNAYTGIVIREDDGNYVIKINGKKHDNKYESISFRLTDILKGLPDDKKIIYIIDSFLENSYIDRIDTDVSVVGYTGKFVVIMGSRTLHLKISNPELLRYIINMIKAKYDRDRYKYLSNIDSNKYSINLNDRKSSYGMEFVPCDDCDNICLGGECPKIVTFNLMYSNGKILGFDKNFIERFIHDKLWECGEVATIYEKRNDVKLADGVTVVGSYVASYLIECGDLTIRFNCGIFNKDYILDFCNQIISRYNGELEEINKYKKRQLKMEGFK